MPAIETIASYEGTSGSTYGAGMMASGDSNSVRAFSQASKAQLLNAMYDYVTTPEPWRITSPLLHDDVQGIRFVPGASVPQELLPPFPLQRLFPQDSLSFAFTTAATTGKALGAISIYYDDLPGANAVLLSPADVFPQVRNIKPVLLTHGSGANTAGTWYEQPLNTTESLLKANTYYALLGIVSDISVAVLSIKGSDTGNLRIGVPGTLNPVEGAEYFVRLSRLTGMPCIPVINSANIGATQGGIISSAATSAAANVQYIFAQLGPST